MENGSPNKFEFKVWFTTKNLMVMLFIATFVYAIVRDYLHRPGGPAQEPPINAITLPIAWRVMYGQDVAGLGFVVPTRGEVLLSITNSTAHHVMLQKSGERQTIFRTDSASQSVKIILDPGQYVLSMVAKGGRRAKMDIEIAGIGISGRD